jgi:hypothetical protein
MAFEPCRKCGAPLPTGANFCLKCGAPLSAVEKSRAPSTEPHRRSKLSPKLMVGLVVGVTSLIVLLLLSSQPRTATDAVPASVPPAGARSPAALSDRASADATSHAASALADDLRGLDPGYVAKDGTLDVEAVKAQVRLTLRDPDSAQFRNIRVVRLEPTTTTRGVTQVCGEVNAKNGFGGYNGFLGFVTARPGMVNTGLTADSTGIGGILYKILCPDEEELRSMAEKARMEEQRRTADNEEEARQAGYQSYAEMQAVFAKEAEAQAEMQRKAEAERRAAQARIDAEHEAEARKAGFSTYGQLQEARRAAERAANAKVRHMHEERDGFMHCDPAII